LGRLIAVAAGKISLEILFEKAGMPDRPVLHAELAGISPKETRHKRSADVL
jgi:hypothetical protein